MNNSAWLQHLRQERLRQSSRNPGLAALMSFCLMGLGQIYAGHVDRGIMLVFVHIGGLICSYSIFTKGVMYDSLAGLLPPSMLIGFFYVAGVALILLWIYNIKEAYYLSIFAGFRDWFEVERVMLPGAAGSDTKLLSQWGIPNMPGMGAWGPTPGSMAGGALPEMPPDEEDEGGVVASATGPVHPRRSREPFADDEDSIPIQAPIRVGKNTAPRPGKGKNVSRPVEASSMARAEAEPMSSPSGEEEFEAIPTTRRKARSESPGREEPVSPARSKKGRRRRIRQMFASIREQGRGRWALGIGVVVLAAVLLLFWSRRDERETLSLAGDFAAIGRILPTSGEDEAVGVALLHRGMIASAVDRLEVAVQRDPARPELWQALLQGVRQLGVPERHSQTLKRYLERFPRDIERSIELAGVQRSRREFVDASRLLTSALAADPTHVRANYLFGAIYRELGMAEEAVAPLKRAVAGDPLNPEFNLELGAAYLSLRNARLAKKYLEKALAVEYRNEAAQRLLSQLDELVGSGGDVVGQETSPELAAIPEPHPGAPVPAPFPAPASPRILYPPEPMTVPVAPQIAPVLPPDLPSRLPGNEQAAPLPQPTPREGISGQAGIGGRSGGLGVVLYAAPGFEKRNPTTGGTQVTPRADGRPVILDPLPTEVSTPRANEPVPVEPVRVASAPPVVEPPANPDPVAQEKAPEPASEPVVVAAAEPPGPAVSDHDAGKAIEVGKATDSSKIAKALETPAIKPTKTGKDKGRIQEPDFEHMLAVEEEEPEKPSPARKADPPPAPKAVDKDPLAQGREKYLAGRWEEALPHLLEALKKRESAEAYGMVGHIFQKLGMQEDGYGASLRAYQLGQRDGPAIARLGMLAAGAGRHQDASRYLREALGRAPKRMDLRMKLAETLRASGDTAGAREELESILSDRSLSAAVRRKVERELAGLAKPRSVSAPTAGEKPSNKQGGNR